MQCPLCNVEMRITAARNVLENDDTPNKETKLYIEQDLTCMNKRCGNYNRVIHTEKTELPIG